MRSVSVVIPSYSARQMLEKNLPSVFAALRDGDEVIIVEDAGTDDTFSWFASQYKFTSLEPSVPDSVLYTTKVKNIDLKILINQHNLRFASSCNRGAVTAKHEIIILLNNDVSPEPDFLQPLLSHFSDPLVFAVGCKELASSEGNKEYGRSGGKFERGFFIHWREDNQNATETAWVAGGSGAFRKDMWEELGGFDLDYKPAYWEDIDLCFRAKVRGWKVLFEPVSIVHHNHESTNATVFGKGKMEVMAYKNQILFMWKNAKGIELLNHFLWLPYHLLFTTVRSHGRFLKGFMFAIKDYFT